MLLATVVGRVWATQKEESLEGLRFLVVQPWMRNASGAEVQGAETVVAVDTIGAQTKEDAPGVMLVDLYLFARWRATATIPQLINCETAARADVSDAALGDPAAANWQALGEKDPLIAAVCT